MRERQKERKETCCANSRLKINIQRDKRERERKRDSSSCERQRVDKTHARDESTEARFPQLLLLLLLLLPVASGGAFKRTLSNCILDGRNFSAGVVVSRKVPWFESWCKFRPVIREYRQAKAQRRSYLFREPYVPIYGIVRMHYPNTVDHQDNDTSSYVRLMIATMHKIS